MTTTDNNNNNNNSNDNYNNMDSSRSIIIIGRVPWIRYWVVIGGGMLTLLSCCCNDVSSFTAFRPRTPSGSIMTSKPGGGCVAVPSSSSFRPTVAFCNVPLRNRNTATSSCCAASSFPPSSSSRLSLSARSDEDDDDADNTDNDSEQEEDVRITDSGLSEFLQQQQQQEQANTGLRHRMKRWFGAKPAADDESEYNDDVERTVVPPSSSEADVPVRPINVDGSPVVETNNDDDAFQKQKENQETLSEGGDGGSIDYAKFDGLEERERSKRIREAQKQQRLERAMGSLRSQLENSPETVEKNALGSDTVRLNLNDLFQGVPGLDALLGDGDSASDDNNSLLAPPNLFGEEDSKQDTTPSDIVDSGKDEKSHDSSNNEDVMMDDNGNKDENSNTNDDNVADDDDTQQQQLESARQRFLQSEIEMRSRTGLTTRSKKTDEQEKDVTTSDSDDMADNDEGTIEDARAKFNADALDTLERLRRTKMGDQYEASEDMQALRDKKKAVVNNDAALHEETPKQKFERREREMRDKTGLRRRPPKQQHDDEEEQDTTPHNNSRADWNAEGLATVEKLRRKKLGDDYTEGEMDDVLQRWREGNTADTSSTDEDNGDPGNSVENVDDNDDTWQEQEEYEPPYAVDDSSSSSSSDVTSTDRGNANQQQQQDDDDLSSLFRSRRASTSDDQIYRTIAAKSTGDTTGSKRAEWEAFRQKEREMREKMGMMETRRSDDDGLDDRVAPDDDTRSMRENDGRFVPPNTDFFDGVGDEVAFFDTSSGNADETGQYNDVGTVPATTTAEDDATIMDNTPQPTTFSQDNNDDEDDALFDTADEDIDTLFDTTDPATTTNMNMKEVSISSQIYRSIAAKQGATGTEEEFLSYLEKEAAMRKKMGMTTSPKDKETNTVDLSNIFSDEGRSRSSMTVDDDEDDDDLIQAKETSMVDDDGSFASTEDASNAPATPFFSSNIDNADDESYNGDNYESDSSVDDWIRAKEKSMTQEKTKDDDDVGSTYDAPSSFRSDGDDDDESYGSDSSVDDWIRAKKEEIMGKKNHDDSVSVEARDDTPVTPFFSSDDDDENNERDSSVDDWIRAKKEAMLGKKGKKSDDIGSETFSAEKTDLSDTSVEDWIRAKKQSMLVDDIDDDDDDDVMKADIEPIHPSTPFFEDFNDAVDATSLEEESTSTVDKAEQLFKVKDDISLSELAFRPSQFAYDPRDLADLFNRDVAEDDEYYMRKGGMEFSSFDARKADMLENTEITVMDINALSEHNPLARLSVKLQPDSAFGSIFRLEGTLVDTTAMHMKAWTKVADVHGFEHPSWEEVQLAQLKRPDEAVLSVFFWSFDMMESKDIAASHYDALEDVFNDWMEQNKSPSAADNADSNNENMAIISENRLTHSSAIENLATDNKPLFTVTEGAVEWLQLIRNVNMPTAVTSHLDRAKLDAILHATELAEFFPEDTRVSANDGYKRESQEMLGAALRIERRPDHCFVVDSTPSASVAAHDVGMKSLALIGAYGYFDLNTADLTVRYFDELSVMNTRRLFSDNEFDEPMLELESDRPRSDPGVRGWAQGDR